MIFVIWHYLFPLSNFFRIECYFYQCMQRLKPGVDIVLDILIAVAEAQPQSEFAKSLLQQYQERGGLSKKQLQGLYGKALKVESIAPGKLATLEAIILKKHTKNRSALPETKPLYEKDLTTGKLIESILNQFPAHKRVLYLKSKYDNNEVLGTAELSELTRFSKLLK
jgi:DNA repair protein RadC